MSESSERRGQKARTRESILAGARELIAMGKPVTITTAAAESGISKATAYRYFSDPQVLAAEAGLAVEVSAYEDIIVEARTSREKVLAVSLYFLDLAIEHEPAFRHYLARHLDAWQSSSGEDKPSRGARRVRMFERALEEERQHLSPQRFDALVRALSMSTGTEAMIALFDIVGTNPEIARATVPEVARSLLDTYLGTE